MSTEPLLLLLLPTRAEAARLLEGRVPEDEDPVPARLGGRPLLAALVGFGPAAAGVLAARALAAARPARAVLAGLGGTYRPDRLPVGGVLRATAVATADVGRGRGPAFVGPAALGFAQAPGAGPREVVDRIALGGPPSPPGATDGLLLTVAAASGTPGEADERGQREPAALGEDMEGFPVALAAARAGVELVVLRGISNVAGDAGREGWDLDGAFAALRRALLLLR